MRQSPPAVALDLVNDLLGVLLGDIQEQAWVCVGFDKDTNLVTHRDSPLRLVALGFTTRSAQLIAATACLLVVTDTKSPPPCAV